MLRYGLIRVVPPAAALALLLVAALATGLLASGRADLPGALSPAAAARVSLFGSLGGLLLVACIWRAAAAGRDLAARDRAWLLPAATGPLGPLARYLAGLVLAWSLACAALGLGASVARLGDGPAAADAAASLRQGPALPGPDLLVLDAARPGEAWQVDDPGGLIPSEGALSLLVRALAGAGPSGELEVSLVRSDATLTTRHRIAGARRLVVPLPAGARTGDPLEVRLTHVGGAPLAMASAEARLHTPAPAGLVDLELALHLWLLGLGALGLGLGLGAWLRPLLALLATLALGLAGLVAAAGPGLAPLGTWLDALAATGEGWVPASPPLAGLAAALFALAAGLGLLRGGLTRGAA